MWDSRPRLSGRVIVHSDVDGIHRLRHGQVASDAIVLLISGLAQGRGELATLILVAGQTTLAEVGDLFFGSRNPVRAVARSAAKAPLARAEAPAGFDLFDLPHELLPVVGRVGVVDEVLKSSSLS